MSIQGKIVHIDEKWALLLSNKNKKHKIKLKNLNTALYNDIVEVELERGNSKVSKIINRSDNRYLGIYQQSQKHGFVRTTGQQCYTDFFISPKYNLNAKDGDLVEVSFHAWEKEKSPNGQILNIISVANEAEKAVYQYKLPYQFPTNVLEETKNIEIKPNHLRDRVDLTHLKCYTIDPKNSRDFDDAVSLEKLNNNYYRVGIHIADVTSLVKENSYIDLEALRRSFSLYLPNTVIPMLPHRLSNGILSLKHDELRLAVSLLLDIDEDYNVVNHIFTQSIISVKQNLHYQQVNNILNDEKHDDYQYFSTLNSIAKKLAKNKRLQIFESRLKLEVDENNNFIPVIRERKEAEKMIEELMIITNSSIAAELSKFYPASLLRSHDSPNDFKLQKLSQMSSKLGYQLDKDNIVEELHHILENDNTNLKYLLSYYLLTSQQKAIYSTHSKGHFGLNLPHYTHFTSPIRRYSDIMVHRMIIKLLKHKKRKESNLQQKIAWINKKEQLINEVERNIYEQQIYEYLKKCDDTIDGQIIDIQKNYLKVRSEYFVNGIIRKQKRTHQLGEFLKLKVDKIDRKGKKIEFVETE